jgi:hypothetical protein
MSPVRAFATVFLAVFLLIFIASALITFLQPQTFAASARVSLPNTDTATIDHFLSPAVLNGASKDLDLPNRLARDYGQSSPLSEDRVMSLLLRSIQLRPDRGTNTLEIRAYGRTPQDCTALANSVAERGAAEFKSPAGFVRLLDRAVPQIKPVRPNVPLNLALGAIVGAFLGTMAGGVGAKLAVGFDGKPPGRGLQS